MTALPSNEYTATLPGFTCLDTVTYYVSVDTSVGRQSDPRTAPGEVYAADVFSGSSQAINESFETDTGWLVGPNTATSGIWTRGNPNATAAQPEDDVSGDGVNCWYTGESAPAAAVGVADIDGGTTVLTSRACRRASRRGETPRCGSD